MANWSKNEVRKRVRGYSNEKLLEEALYANCGDDHDGIFTNYGLFEATELTKELRSRLAGWLAIGGSK